VRDALETLVKHASSQNRRIRSGNSQDLICLFMTNIVPCAHRVNVSSFVTIANALHRHLEEALTRTEAVSARSQDKLDSRMDKVQEEMESVRACAVCIQPLTLLQYIHPMCCCTVGCTGATVGRCLVQWHLDAAL